MTVSAVKEVQNLVERRILEGTPRVRTTVSRANAPLLLVRTLSINMCFARVSARPRKQRLA